MNIENQLPARTGPRKPSGALIGHFKAAWDAMSLTVYCGALTLGIGAVAMQTGKIVGAELSRQVDREIRQEFPEFNPSAPVQVQSQSAQPCVPR